MVSQLLQAFSSLVGHPTVLLLYPCTFFILYKYFLYPAFVSPLSKIPPAHPTCSWSPFLILWKRYFGGEVEFIHAAHLKHGPIVRLGPHELSVNCVDGGLRTIYTGGFEKPNWYPNLFSNFEVPNMFSTVSSRPHSARKRLVSNLYSKSFLQSCPLVTDIVQEIIFERYLPMLHTFAKNSSPFDVRYLNHAIAMDFVSAYVFGGTKVSTNFIRDEGAMNDWLHHFLAPRPYWFWFAEMPGLWQLLMNLGWNLVPKDALLAPGKIEEWCAGMCIEAAKGYSPQVMKGEVDDEEKASASSSSSSPQTVFGKLTRALAPPGTQPFATDTISGLSHTDKHIASEVLDHLAAGQETAGLTLTFLIHELSQRPNVQSRLRAELLTLNPPLALASSAAPGKNNSEMCLPNLRQIDALPLLHAVIMETLRLRAPLGGPQPRITPTSRPPSTTTLANSPPLPPNVRVSAQAYSLHRNPSVFPDPESFCPERWLASEDSSGNDKAKIEEMGRWFWAFGSGGRMCVGSNFAMMELKLVVAALYTSFQTVLVEEGEGGNEVGGMEQVQRYVGMPKSERLFIRVREVGEGEREGEMG